MLARVAAGETIESYETVRRCKDGRLIDIFLTVSPIKDNDGNVVGVSKIAHDTTEMAYQRSGCGAVMPRTPA